MGLDSNNVNVGPNTYVIGARVCNVGSSPANNLTITFNASGSSAISLQFPAFQTISKNTVPGIPQLVSLPSGPDPEIAYPNSGGGQTRRAKYNINFTPPNCFDAYYNIKVARNPSSYDATLPYQITASADNTSPVSTPAGRQLYVERLISQARNSILSFTNLTTGSNTVYVGGTYDFALKAATATAYPQLVLTSDFPNIVFQLLRVKTTYETPTGTVNSTVYADACGWISDPSFIGYHTSSSACNGINYPKQYGDGSDSDAKVGNNVTTVYTIKVLAMPSTAGVANPVPVSHLILDYSGSSYHYNADNGTGLGLTYITVVDAPDLTINKTAPTSPLTVGTNFNYTLNISNLSTTAGTNGTTTIQENLPSGMQFQSFTGSGWSCKNALGNACTAGDQGTLNFSNSGVIPANGTSSITLTVKPTISGSNIANTATVSTPNDKDTTNNSSTVNVNVNPAPDLKITKTGSVSVGQGQTGVSYTLAVQNIGTVSTSGTITVTDTLPTGLTPNATKISTDNTANGWTCNTSGQVVTCTRSDTFAASANLPNIIITADVPANATAGVVTNTATVSGGGDGNASNNTANLSVQIGSSPDLTISKTSTPTSFTKGGTATYNLTVNNIGNQATNGATITVTDILPTGITANFTNPSTFNGWTCNASGQTVTCSSTVNLVATTGTSTFGLPVTISAAASGNSFVNQALVSVPGDGNINNNSTTLTTGTGPDVTILKIASGNFSAGGTGNYAITVSNIGGTTTTGAITFNDTISDAKVAYSSYSAPAGWTCTGSAQTFSCTNPSPNLAPGASATINVTVSIASGVAQTVPNTVTIDTTNNGGDTNTTNNSSSTTTGSGAVPDLTVSKSLSGGTYTITVGNSSAATASTPNNRAVTMTDTLPSGVTVSNVNTTATNINGWSCTRTTTNPIVVTCTIQQAIAAGNNYPAITLNVSGLPTSGSFINTANVAFPPNTYELNTSNNSVSLTTTIPTAQDLTISKIGPTTLAQGQSGNYILRVRNLGQTATTATQIFVTDTLPTGMTATSASGTGWTCPTVGATVSCNRSDALAAGSSYPDITVAVEVAGNATTGTRTNTAQVTGTNVFPATAPTAAGGETNTANNTSSVNINITGVPDLTISKTDSGSFTQGGTGSYTLTVTNSGSAATNGQITVTDTLPTGITPNFTSPTTFSGWSCSYTGQTVTCTNSTVINAAGTSSLTLPVNISTTAASSVTNNAIAFGGGESNSSNNTASKTTTVNSVPDLTILKTHTPSNFTQGQTGSYTLSVVNIGNAATSGTVTVTDTLPATSGLTATTASGTGWSCTISANQLTVTCTTSDALNGGNNAYPDITIGVNVSSTAPTSPTPVNSATVSGGGDTNNGNNTATDSTPIVAPAGTPDLTIIKTHTGNFDQGGTGSYSLTASNVGSVAVANGTTVTVTDSLPPDLSAAPPTASGTGWSCSHTGNSTTGYTVTCTRNDGLTAGSSYPVITLGVTVSNNPRNELFNSASVALAIAENNVSNNYVNDTTYINQTDLSITKTAPATLSPGQNGAVYTLSVVNVGGKATNGSTVTVSDTLPAGLTPTAASGAGWTCGISGQTVTCTRTSVLAANGAAYPDISLTVNVAASPPTYIVNTASVSGGGDINTSNNENSVGTSTGTDLAISKTHTGTFLKGGTGTFNLLVSNVGGSATSGTVTVTDTLVTGFTPTAASGTGWSCNVSGQTVTCTRSDSLASGQSYNPILINVNISGTAPNSLTNTASVSGGGDVVNISNNSGTDTVYFGADITIVKTHSGTFSSGQSGTYNLTVSNVGGAASSGTVTVTDTLPSGFTATAAGGSGWACSPSTGAAISCTRSDGLAAGSSYPAVAVTVSVPANPNPAVTNTANVAGGGDVNTNNNSSSDTVTFSNTPKLLLVKRITAINGVDLTGFVDNTDAADPTAPDDNDSKWPAPNTTYLRGKIDGGFVKPGDVLEYTVYFLSKGGGDSKNVTICDLVPANTTFQSQGFNSDTGITIDTGATGTDLGIALGWSSSSLPTTPTQRMSSDHTDGDRGQFFPANTGTGGATCSATNTNGAVVVKVVSSGNVIPKATGAGTPVDSYGFIRFRAQVK
ncbi:beta strand repeat-containing protein [Chlorogloeopsis fritschii PCC 9212]|uniref:DUF11 domain-containing protein n=1 Tax=Chlorogloeopsis fritschii PCC 6912 TaxID=211165 RepID=A0A3S1FHQ9_CHLFR|nr:hypothetical protein [Chlorogloeopsis fritschii]RUR78747.1 hypothetical protein PCC6912_35120 [Chlorogloeopsis fritschii PCC 6912]